MDFKSQICTTREQSERLLALGLKKETADMCWTKMAAIRGTFYVPELAPINMVSWRHTPAWSLHRLLSLLPDYIVVNSSSGLNPNFYLNIRDGFVSYKDNRGFSYGSTSGNMYDAITRMISFLIKEGPCMFDYFEKSIWNGNYCVGYINQSRGDSLARYLVAFISKDKNECVRELIDWIKLRK